MSHVVTITAQVRDIAGVQAACRRLKLPEPVLAKVQLFSGDFTGLSVQLPEWRYPIVCDIPAGEIRYDNFEGNWGDPARLHEFLQAYAVEKTRIEARKQGHIVSEQVLSDGSVKLVIEVTGGSV